MTISEKLRSLDEALDAYESKDAVCGGLRVTVKGETVFKKYMGYANSYTKETLSDDSVFTVYSMSKPFCAMGLLRLFDEGKIDLDAHPSRYLPEAESFHPALKITHLLTHTSGLPDFLQTKAFTESHPSAYSANEIRAQMRDLAAYPSLFAPGTEGLYENVNFTVAALICENVADLPYGEYMKRFVFEPLDMPHTAIDCDGYECAHRASGHHVASGIATPVSRSIAYMLGGGDVLSTLDDIYALNRAVKEKLLLKDRTWQLALTPSPINSMGMGCTVSRAKFGCTRVIHNGGHVGFRTLHTHHLESDFDLILLSNCDHPCVRDVVYDLCVRHLLDSDGIPLDTSGMDKGYI